MKDCLDPLEVYPSVYHVSSTSCRNSHVLNFLLTLLECICVYISIFLMHDISQVIINTLFLSWVYWIFRIWIKRSPISPAPPSIEDESSPPSSIHTFTQDHHHGGGGEQHQLVSNPSSHHHFQGGTTYSFHSMRSNFTTCTTNTPMNLQENHEVRTLHPSSHPSLTEETHHHHLHHHHPLSHASYGDPSATTMCPQNQEFNPHISSSHNIAHSEEAIQVPEITFSFVEIELETTTPNQISDTHSHHDNHSIHNTTTHNGSQRNQNEEDHSSHSVDTISVNSNHSDDFDENVFDEEERKDLRTKTQRNLMREERNLKLWTNMQINIALYSK